MDLAAAPTETPGILDHRNTVRNYKTDWKAYQQSNFLESHACDLLSAFANANHEGRNTFLQEKGTEVVVVIINLLNKVSKLETIQSLITMLDDMFEEDSTRIELLFKASVMAGVPAFQTFLQVLETKDNTYVQHQANRILARIATKGDSILPLEVQQCYFSWILDAVKCKEADISILALASLQKILRNPAYRQSFYEFRDSIGTLRDILTRDASQHIQSQYMTMFCLWTLSFSSNIAGKLDEEHPNTIADIASLLRSTRKEKVTRLCVGTMRNLLEYGGKGTLRNATMMITNKMRDAVELILSQGSDDDECKDDSLYVQSKLNSAYEEMSTFDEYANEIKSGRLEWSPVHKSERFWRENATELNADQHRLIKILVQLLETSEDSLVLAVAAHDVGEYVRYYPRGKAIVEKLGGKTAILRHMHNADPAVRYESLIAVQKLMTQNWGILEKSLQKAQGPKTGEETDASGGDN